MNDIKTTWHPFNSDADETPDILACEICGKTFDGIGGPEGNQLFACSFPCKGKNKAGHFHAYCKEHAK